MSVSTLVEKIQRTAEKYELKTEVAESIQTQRYFNWVWKIKTKNKTNENKSTQNTYLNL